MFTKITKITKRFVAFVIFVAFVPLPSARFAFTGGSYKRGAGGLIGARHETTPFVFTFRLNTLSPLVT
jgi:hypothetical protein